MRLPLPRTVFGRTLLVLLLAGSSIQLLIVYSLHGPPPPPGAEQVHLLNFRRFTGYIAKELAQDPRPERVRELLGGTGMTVQATGVRSWSVETGPPPRAARVDDKAVILERPTRIKTSVPVRGPAGDLVFTFVAPVRGPKAGTGVLVMFSAVLVILLGASVALRSILRPVSALSSALQEMKRGKMDVSLPSGSDDELGRLVRAFNEMAASIRFLIKDKEQMFTELSHEFRAPIARALAANALIEDEALGAQIRNDLTELDGLIHALLTAARLEAGSPQVERDSFEVNGLLREVLDLFPESRERIQLEPSPEPTTCEGDVRSIRMLLRNLVENALKYSPREKPVRLSAWLGDDGVFFRVSDEGSGISREDQDLLFAPFFRGSDAHKGAEPGFGLGLSLCRRIARAHGGELLVESSPGRGTCVITRLPSRAPSVPSGPRVAA